MKNLKPFDLWAALAGKAVMLRNGQKAYVRHRETELAVEDEDRLMGYNSGVLIGWDEHGNHMGSGEQSSLDIIGMYPETRIVNGFEVPVPETEEPTYNNEYFFPCISSTDFFVQSTWEEATFDKRQLSRGLVFLTKESAIATAKAMVGIDPNKNIGEQED